MVSGRHALPEVKDGRADRKMFEGTEKDMEIACICRKEAVRARDILADFLKSFAAVTKYGRTVIYEGEIYYIPCYMLTYQVEETGERYGFLAGALCEDISVFRLDEKSGIETVQREVLDGYVLFGEKTAETVREEVSRKIRLNKRLRKMFMRFHIKEISLRSVYLPEQTFYVKGKSTDLFLVDDFLRKVDFKNAGAVGRRFVENCRGQGACGFCAQTRAEEICR